MKTSNIIVTALIASVTLLITMGMVEYRIKGVPHGSVVHKQPDVNSAPIPAFHFVVVDGARNITLETSDAFTIEMPHLPDSVLKELTYRVQRDTLYIKGSPSLDGSSFVNIKAPAEQVRWIEARNAQVIVGNFSLDRFVVKSDRSHLSLQSPDAINTLVIEGVNESRIDFFETNTIVTMDLNLDHSEIAHFGALSTLKGSIRNQSKAELRNVNAFAFIKDSTSRLSVFSE